MDDNNLNKLDQQISNVCSRLSIDYIDVSYGEIIAMYKQDELIIRPEYQRFYRWNSKQKTSLIESILLGIPIPPIYVVEDKIGIWELVDGFQRISTIISFFGALKEDLTASHSACHNSDDDIKENLIHTNKWTLDAGALVAGLKGYNVDTLPKKYIIKSITKPADITVYADTADVTFLIWIILALIAASFVIMFLLLRDEIKKKKAGIPGNHAKDTNTRTGDKLADTSDSADSANVPELKVEGHTDMAPEKLPEETLEEKSEAEKTEAEATAESKKTEEPEKPKDRKKMENQGKMEDNSKGKK